MRLRSFAAATAVLVFSLSAHADNLIRNGGFESNFSGYSAVFANNGSELFVSSPGHSGQHAAVFGGVDVGDYDQLSQLLPTGAGSSYDISFYLLVESDVAHTEDFQALWNGTVIFDDAILNLGGEGTFTGADPWIHVSLHESALGNDTLSFRAFNNDSFDALDDIAVSTATPAAAPEPSSLALLGTGILGVIGAARRRFAA